jgi:hypothetical protein
MHTWEASPLPQLDDSGSDFPEFVGEPEWAVLSVTEMQSVD